VSIDASPQSTIELANCAVTRMQILEGHLRMDKGAYAAQALPNDMFGADGKTIALLWCIMLERA
jgi:hypothetical protein